MVRVGVAPCSPFSVSRELMRDAALLARDKGVMLHTHLAENDEDVAYSLATVRLPAGPICRGSGLDRRRMSGTPIASSSTRQEIDLFARTRTGVAHCPCSNCRLGSGIAPVRAMRDAGVPVGLGVDGSASNDSGNLVAEARQAMLLQRVARGADAMSAREALEIATRGGAEVLGRDDCGRDRGRQPRRSRDLGRRPGSRAPAAGIRRRCCWRGRRGCAICSSRAGRSCATAMVTTIDVAASSSPAMLRLALAA